MAERPKKWSDLSPAQQRLSMVGGLVQVTLLVAALLDLRKRSPDEINGSKRMWFALAFVNFVGPISYFLFGRRRAA